MMITFRYGKQLWGVLFCFFFLLYAISPLTYTLHKTETIQRFCSAPRASTHRASFRVFLVEVIREAVYPSEKRPQRPENDTVPIRKKRALIPENAGEKLFSYEPAAITHNENFPLPQMSYEWLKTSISIVGTSKGFRLLYAGHSPPES